MTEEEFKKTMIKISCLIVVALVVLVIIGILVFNQSGKATSIFGSQKEVDDYKKKVQEVNSHNITEEEVEELEGSSEFQENGDDDTEETSEAEEVSETEEQDTEQ